MWSVAGFSVLGRLFFSPSPEDGKRRRTAPSMYILYLDESGDPNGWQTQNHFVMGGVAVFEGEVHALSKQLDVIQASFFPGISVPIPFHATDIRAGHGRFRDISSPEMNTCGVTPLWLDQPNSDVWEQRRRWFEQLSDSIAGEGGYEVSEQACALIGELEVVFCAGAWIACIVMAVAVVDAQLRETEVPSYRGNTKKLLKMAKANPLLQKLRERRNAIIHLDPDAPAITVDQQWQNRAQLEEDARKAVKLMFEAFYMSPWV